MMGRKEDFTVGSIVWIHKKRMERLDPISVYEQPKPDETEVKPDPGPGPGKRRLPWPGKVTEPPPDHETRSLNRKKYWIYFFARKYYAWVTKAKVTEYVRHYIKKEDRTIPVFPTAPVNSTLLYRKAIEAANRYFYGLSQESDKSSSSDEDIACIFPSNCLGSQIMQSFVQLSRKSSSSLEDEDDDDAINGATVPSKSCSSSRTRSEHRGLVDVGINTDACYTMDACVATRTTLTVDACVSTESMDVDTQDDLSQPPILIPEQEEGFQRLSAEPPTCDLEVDEVRNVEETPAVLPVNEEHASIKELSSTGVLKYKVIGCPPPSLFTINRKKNPNAEHSFVVVEPLNELVKRAARVKVRSRRKIPVGFQLTLPVMKFGVVGMGLLGTRVASALLQSHHHIFLYDDSRENCLPFEQRGAAFVSSVSLLYSGCDVIFCCSTSINVAKEMLFSSSEGVCPIIKRNKGVVIFTTMDISTSTDIAEIFKLEGGKYLEAPVFYPSNCDSNQSFFIITAGDKDLFEGLSSHFRVISPFTAYVGVAGNATKLCIILNSFMGTIICSLVEVIYLGKKIGLFDDNECITDFVKIINFVPGMGNLINIERSDVESLLCDRWPFPLSPGDICKSIELVMAVAHNTGKNQPVTTAAKKVVTTADFKCTSSGIWRKI